MAYLSQQTNTCWLRALREFEFLHYISASVSHWHTFLGIRFLDVQLCIRFRWITPVQRINLALWEVSFPESVRHILRSQPSRMFEAHVCHGHNADPLGNFPCLVNIFLNGALLLRHHHTPLSTEGRFRCRQISAHKNRIALQAIFPKSLPLHDWRTASTWVTYWLSLLLSAACYPHYKSYLPPKDKLLH